MFPKVSTDSSRVPRDGVCIECLCLLLGRGAVEGKTRLPFVGSALVLLWERRMRRFWCPCGSHSLEGASAVRTGYTVRCIAATRSLPSPGLKVVPYAQKCCRQLDRVRLSRLIHRAPLPSLPLRGGDSSPVSRCTQCSPTCTSTVVWPSCPCCSPKASVASPIMLTGGESEVHHPLAYYFRRT